MKKLKSTIQYILLIAFVLLAIWSRSWVLISMVFIACILLWQQSAKSNIRKLLNKLSKWQQRLFEWTMAIALALLGLWFLNANILSFYTLRSNSMRPMYQNNELVFINKLAYGAAQNSNNPKRYKRLKGYSDIKRGDVIAFHFPEADTAFVEQINEDYFYIKRQYNATKKHNPLLNAAIEYNPVSKRKTFIKRLIALPGDTLLIRNGNYWVDGSLLEHNKHHINRYKLTNDVPFEDQQKMLEQAQTSYRENGSQLIEIKAQIVTDNKWHKLLVKQEEVLNMPNTYVFPFEAGYLWNASHMGPIIIPTKGKTVRLTLTNLPLYKRIIESYEENTLTVNKDGIMINGRHANEYTFQMNYYWVSGDNRKHSFDSRYWGFVPENHIIGRVEKL